MPTFGQGSDQQLAKHYYNNGEYDKALLYYEKLYDKNPSDYYYDYYFKTLMALEQFKDAEKLVKGQKKRQPNKVKYAIDLGEVYEATDQEAKANAIYDDAIKDVPENFSSVLQLGQAFTEKGKLDRALLVYQKGKKSIKNYPFGLKTAEIHGKLGHTNEMLGDYLDVVVEFNNYMVSVQNALTRVVDFDDPDNPTTEKLRVTLLQRIQKDPDQIVYTEMLIWHFIQIQDFNSAMIQGKALDRRLKNSNGEDVMILSRMCRANKAYDVAIKGYNYVLEKYPEGYHSTNARLESMGTLYEKITTSSYTKQELTDLEAKYEHVLAPEQMGKTNITVPLMLQLAHVEAFYLYNRTKALSILENALATPRISPTHRAQCKMALGDVHVLAGNVWDASLYYLQVEKTFKEDLLGHEAKFRNAKIYYYTGQFEWAQAQLNVLKASTSKLIANDAMELSLIITDNMGLDTTARPMLLYASADLLIFQNKFKEAELTLDTISNIYGDHALSDEILYKKFEIAYKQRNFEKAVPYLEAIITKHGDDILGDDATYKLAEIYDFQFKDKTKAKAYYKKILFDYSGSIYTAESRKRFRAMGGADKSDDGFKPIILDPEDPEDQGVTLSCTFAT